MTAAELEELMHETLRAALKRQREEFQVKYGDFMKCSRCGAYLGGTVDWWNGFGQRCDCNPTPNAPAYNIRTGYAPPPEDR